MENNVITKKNGNIAFAENNHTYWDITDPTKKFTSVTTIIEKFAQPYDKEFWSAYKTLQNLLSENDWEIEKKSLLSSKKFDKSILQLYNISENTFNKKQQDLLDSWSKENTKSCERGTKIHSSLENSFYKKKKNIDISKFQIGGTFECRKDYTDLDLENAIYPEYLIHRVSADGKLCIAGQIDLLVKKGNHITICDWKGLPLDTEIPTLTGWSTIKNLQVGDIIFDKNGIPTKIIHKSSVHTNPCYKITFNDENFIIADHEHKWEIYFNDKSQVMTTESIYCYMQAISEDAPKIINNKPLELLKQNNQLINPYEFGLHLESNEIIPDSLQRDCFEQRLLLLRGIMDSYGEYIKENKTFIININSKYYDSCIKLLSSLGIKSQIKSGILFKVNKFNPFLNKYQDIDLSSIDVDNFRTIIKVEKVDTIETQCLEVDSPTHTFLFSRNMIVTHNTNKEIRLKSFYDTKTKSSIKMKFPLNTIEDSNYWHYVLQLSTYAWMIQKLKPDYIIDDLVLVHFTHDDNFDVYHLPYLKKEVEKMLAFYKKQVQLENNINKNKKIEY